MKKPDIICLSKIILKFFAEKNLRNTNQLPFFGKNIALFTGKATIIGFYATT